MTEVTNMARAILLRVTFGVLVVVSYGLVLYAIIWAAPDPNGPLMVISGALLVSMGVGSLSSVLTDPLGRLPLWQHIYISLIELLLLCLLTLILFAEGVVCLIMAVPIMIPGLLLGVWIAWATARWWRNRGATLTVIALPLLVYPLEMQMNWPDYQGHVSTEIAIAAPPRSGLGQYGRDPRHRPGDPALYPQPQPDVFPAPA